MGINDPSYVALVAALRAEFGPGALAAMSIQLRPHRGNATSLGVLVDAVRDAGDVLYDAGEDVHRAIKEFLARTRGGGS